MLRVSPLLLTTFLSAGLACFGMAGLSWSRRRIVPGGIWLVVLLLAIGEILSMYALSYGGVFTATQKIWLIDITYVGWLIVPPSFLIYIARITGRDRWLTPAALVSLAVIALGFAVVIWGPNSADAFFGGGRDLTTFDFPASSPLYTAFIAYSYVLLTIVAIMIVRSARESARIQPLQTALLIAMAVLPWFLSLLSFVNIRVLGADPTVLSMIVVALMTFSMTQFTTLDIRAMTEAEVQLASDTGVVVVDRRGRLTRMNSTAARMLGPGISPAMGLQLEKVWADHPAIVAALHGADLGGITVTNSAGDRLLAFEYSPIIEASGRESGTLILVRDQALHPTP